MIQFINFRFSQSVCLSLSVCQFLPPSLSVSYIIAPDASLGTIGRGPPCCIAAWSNSAPLLLGGIITYKGPINKL